MLSLIRFPVNRKNEMLSDNINDFKSKPVNIHNITILLDNGYYAEKIIQELKKIYPAIINQD